MYDNYVVFIVFCFVGTSFDTYVRWLVVDGLTQCYRPVVMNYRGTAGIPIKASLVSVHVIKPCLTIRCWNLRCTSHDQP